MQDASCSSTEFDKKFMESLDSVSRCKLPVFFEEINMHCAT
jgi:hypothetical protein